MLLILFLQIVNLAAAISLHKPRSLRCGELIVFGDSLSDDGFELGESSFGFERNSNGPVWPEYLNKLLACGKYVNYAHSGAKSGQDNVYFNGWSGIFWQINTYLNSNPTQSSDNVILLQTGGLLDYLGGEDIEDNVVKNISVAIDKLIKNIKYSNHGYLVIMNLFDPSDAPGVQFTELDENAIKKISQLIALTNLRISKKIFRIRREVPNVGLFDLNSALTDAIQRLNSSSPFTYQSNDLISRTIYDYAFHDLWNPSTIVHQQVAAKIVAFLEDFNLS